MKQRQLFSALLCFVVLFVGIQATADEMMDETSQEKVFEELSDEAIVDAIDAADEIESMGFQEAGPEMKSLSARQSFSHLDPKGLVPKKLLNEAVSYFAANLGRIKNENYLSVIDFGAHASKARFFIINMSTGAVSAFHVAHGSGSDAANDGYAEKFSNTSGSNASSLGFYLASETYQGKHGLSVRLDGLSSTNSNARARAVVIHGADYVKDSNVKAGRSWGCPAVSMASRNKVVQMVKGGSLIYAGR